MEANVIYNGNSYAYSAHHIRQALDFAVRINYHVVLILPPYHRNTLVRMLVGLADGALDMV